MKHTSKEESITEFESLNPKYKSLNPKGISRKYINAKIRMSWL